MVGTVVGVAVGSEEGAAVGRTVGSEVGLAEGEAVGSSVGARVGREVGLCKNVVTEEKEGGRTGMSGRTRAKRLAAWSARRWAGP